MTSPLTGYLRAMPDDALGALLARRPDLLTPPASDFSALAARSQSRVSIARALDGLDLFTLEVLDAARLTRSASDSGLASADAIVAMCAPVDPHVVRAAITRLRDLLIMYGPLDELHVVPSVEEVCSRYPAGLGRPAEVLNDDAAGLAADPAGLRRALLAASPASRAVLDRLAAGPPIGTVTPEAIGDPSSAVGALVAKHLLVAVSHDTVELPREVAVALRRDGMLGPTHPRPPVASTSERPVKTIDSAGTGQVMDVVRHVSALLEALSEDPAPLLRTGGMGVRDLRRLARAAGIGEPAAALLIEVAAAAGLIGETDGSGSLGGSATGSDARFLPTLAFDQWQAAPTAVRWVRLAQSWLAMNRQPGLIGKRLTRPGAAPPRPTQERDRLINALGPEAERTGAPRIRAAVLGVLASGPAGHTPSPEEVLAAVHWQAPRRSPWQPSPVSPWQADNIDPAAADPVRWALDEATQLGLTGFGGLTSFGRALLDETISAADRDPDTDPLGLAAPESAPAATTIAMLDKMLPVPVDHVLVQADLTVVVPGPPEPELAAELAVVAEHESAGGASVYRVTPESLRRALDSGHTASELQKMFARRSRTGVPQGLSYLIDDTARRHGGLRLGGASTYLRSDDTALLAEIAADRRLVALGFRSIAPTVLVSPVPPARAVATLRDAGYSPVHEDGYGAVVSHRPRAFRAPPRRSPLATAPFADVARGLTTPRLAAAVEALRKGDTAAREARRAPADVRSGAGGVTAAQAHTQALAVLQQAIRDKQRVWVGYVDAHGANASRLLRPVSMGAGYLRAEDERTEMLHTLALHRITAAVVDV